MVSPHFVYKYSAVVLLSFPISSLVNGLERADATEIVLESFDQPIHKWKQMNDPVMGGRSTGTFTIKEDLGIFQGEVVDVPFLHAPGFIQARTVDKHGFPDISTCQGIQLNLRALEAYDGYRISFGHARPKHGKRFAYGYKADLKDVPVGMFADVTVPLHKFSDYWDDATGDAIVTCDEDDQYCPDELTLKNMMSFTIWGEGVAGKVSLEIKSIKAVQCNDE